MTTKLVKWASNDGQIIEPGLSDGCRTKLLTSVVEIVYNCPRTGGYLGNVGLYKCTPEWVIPVAPNTSDQMA